MGFIKPFICITSLVVLLLAIILSVNQIGDLFLPKLPALQFEKNWKINNPSGSEEVKSIVIKVPNEVIDKLKDKLRSTIVKNSLHDSRCRYGMNSELVLQITNHWLSKYNWKEWEAKINGLKHYFTEIQGLNMHVVHYKPKVSNGTKIIPILLLHGWPGSFFEFYKLIPMLGTEESDIAFEIICPSLPGFGWSDAPEKQGMDIVAVSSIMFDIMERLKINEKFFVQGGDYGAMIATTMAKIRPNRIAGIHLNMIIAAYSDFRYWARLGMGAILPKSMSFLDSSEINKLYPVGEKIKNVLDRMGYFWLQRTRPDTLAVALSNSPIGLATYIIEKSLDWSTNLTHFHESKDCGLSTNRISLDEMLSNVMVYYITNTIGSSIRYYHELKSERYLTVAKMLVTVPTGLAQFPNELMYVPLSFAKLNYRDIRQYTKMSRGGHFPALEEPELLAADIRSFVKKVLLK